jgi:hypothetical protein
MTRGSAVIRFLRLFQELQE